MTGTGTTPEQKKNYWESLQDAAKIDDYIGWGIGALIIVPLIILFVPNDLCTPVNLIFAILNFYVLKNIHSNLF